MKPYCLLQHIAINNYGVEGSNPGLSPAFNRKPLEASLLSRKLVLSILMHDARELKEEEEPAGISGMDARKATIDGSFYVRRTIKWSSPSINKRRHLFSMKCSINILRQLLVHSIIL